MAYMTRNPNAVEPMEEDLPFICPECGAELDDQDTVYVNDCGAYLGCCHCVLEREAVDELGCGYDD